MSSASISDRSASSARLQAWARSASRALSFCCIHSPTLGGSRISATAIKRSASSRICLTTQTSPPRYASGGESHQAQFRWQWDFQKPLITLDDAAGAQNNLMRKITSGTKITPNGNDQVTFSDLNITAGDPSSGVAPQVVPPSGQLSGISTVGPSQSRIPSSSDAIQIP